MKDNTPKQPTTIYLARHGETRWNVEKRMQGQMDSPLTERGQEQARMLRNRLVSENALTDHENGIAMAFCSTLGRARETLEICLEGTGIPHKALSELDEICLGEWEGLTFSEVEKRWPEQFHNFWHRPSLYVPTANGESFQDVQKRMFRAFEKIYHNYPGKRVLVISHWIAIKTLLARLKGLDLDHIPGIPKPENGEFQVLDFSWQCF